MNPEAMKEDIIGQLRVKIQQAMFDEDDDLTARMADVRKAVKAWDGTGALPHVDELREWGIVVDGDAVASGDAVPSTDGAVAADDLQDAAPSAGEDAPAADANGAEPEPAVQPAPDALNVDADESAGIDGAMAEEPAVAPTAVEPEPATVAPEPAAADSEPMAVGPEPAVTDPEPAVAEPELVAVEPELAPAEPELAPLENPFDLRTDEAAAEPTSPVVEEPPPAAAVASAPAAEPEPVAERVEETTPAEPEPPAWDPDDDLQEAFDNAQALLSNNRYRAALDAFDEVRQKASGRLEGPSEAGYEMAAARLAEQLAPLVDRALRHAEKQPDDLKGQRGLWGRVLEIDPGNETANRALRDLEERDAVRQIDRDIADARDRLGNFVAANNYPAIIGLLGEVDGQAGSNRWPSRQRELDELARDVKAGRDKVRDYLGLSSTKAGSEDYKGAYILAREYADKNLPVALDERGVYGPVGETYETADFLRMTRSGLIDWSRAKALERQAEAKKEALAAPGRALRTLAEARAFLTDEVLSGSDKETLADTLREIEKDEADVNERLTRFRQAEEQVNQAEQAQPRERLRLLQEARAFYADFPDIEGRIERARDDVASVVAGELDNQLVSVRQLWVAEKFDEALAKLAKARTDAINQVPNPAPGSKLDERLGDLDELEKKIIDAQGAHYKLIKILTEVDGLLAAKDADGARKKLNDELSDEERSHRETQARYRRISDVQDVSTSWQQGLQAYAAGHWSVAQPPLEKAAGSAIPEKERAALLLNRTRAAIDVESGKKDEEAKNWVEALNKYRRALVTFERHSIEDPNDPAEPLRRIAEDKRAALQELEQNDILVGQVIEQAQGLLGQAKARADGRKSPEEKVEPIGFFAAAAGMLKNVLDRELRTSRDGELGAQHSQVRALWRTTYLDGLRAALAQKDERLLRRAVALGRTLDDNGLLYEVSHKQVYREAQELLLDLEYERLRRPPPPTLKELQAELTKADNALTDLKKVEGPDSELVAMREGERARLMHEMEQLKSEPLYATALVAENRRERWRMADGDDNRKKLYEEYLSAVRQLVGHQLVAKKQESLRTALTFLAEEMNKPELSEDKEQFAQLIELCWQVGDWREAERRANSLANSKKLPDPELRSELWLGLIAMARHLGRGDRARFEAEEDSLRSRVQDRAELLALLNKQKQKQIDWRVKVLLDRAEESARGEKPRDWLDALLAYSEANTWSRDNAKVTAGVDSLKSRVRAELADRIPAAQHYSLTGTLEDSLSNGEEQLHVLTTIRGLADLLKLEPGERDDLDTAMETLKKKLEPGRKVHASVTQAEREIDEALVNPLPFQLDEGGWSFEDADRLLTQAQTDARRGDRALQGHVQTLMDRLATLKNRADTLNALVREFRQAVTDENFDTVIDVVTTLEQEWRTRQQVDGFRGLEQLIRISYPLDKRSPRNLSEHAKVAVSQKENLTEWQDWADLCQKAYNELKSLAERYTQSLDSLVYREPLAEIVNECDQIRRLYASFADALAQRPAKQVLSRKAQKAAGEIDQNKTTTAEGYDQRAAELRREASEVLRALENGALHRLRGVMIQLDRAKALVGTRPGLFRPRVERIPKQLFENAELYIQEVGEIDPFNEEMARTRDRLDGFKTGPGGLHSPPQEE